MQDGQRVAIVLLSAIGDIVHAFPLLSSLQARYPNARFEGGIGINALTSAEPGWPTGGAVFHDTAVSARRA